jgi:hypothetical protein
VITRSAIALLLASAFCLPVWPQSASKALPRSGFYIRFEVDGRMFDKPLYDRGGTYDHVILYPSDEAADDPARRSLVLAVGALKGAGPPEGIEIKVHDRFMLRGSGNGAQSYTLTGSKFCVGSEGQPDKVIADAVYSRAFEGTTQPYGSMTYEPHFSLFFGTLDEERKNTGTLGFQTEGAGLLGPAEGQLEVLSVDTVNQIIEARFHFKAMRAIVIDKDQWGMYRGRCWVVTDFRPSTVEITRGEFRMRYCLSPMEKNNSIYCANGLSPRAPG